MLLFFSSAQYEYPADPEVVITDAAVMVSFMNNRKRVHRRINQLMRHRVKRNEMLLCGRGVRVGGETRKKRKKGKRTS